jgi:hypothetical protein
VVSSVLTQGQDVNVPKNVLKEFAYFVGDWTMEGKIDDERAEATFSTRWAPGKHMLVFNSSWSGPEGDSLGSGIFGWDAAEEKIVTLEFWSDGWSHHRQYTVKSPTLWEARATGVNSDGERIKQQVTLEKKGPDEWTWRATQTVVGGEDETEAVLHFRKIKK